MSTTRKLCSVFTSNGRIFFSSDKIQVLSLTSLVFITSLCNMGIITTKKMLLQAISELQSKKKGQYLDNIFL